MLQIRRVVATPQGTYPRRLIGAGRSTSMDTYYVVGLLGVIVGLLGAIVGLLAANH
jgi:hypothetical protein